MAYQDDTTVHAQHLGLAVPARLIEPLVVTSSSGHLD